MFHSITNELVFVCCSLVTDFTIVKQNEINKPAKIYSTTNYDPWENYLYNKHQEISDRIILESLNQK